MATYRNPFHKPGKIEFGPAEYQTDAAPTAYRGMLVYRRLPYCFDVVKDATCIGQYAGLKGAKGLIDLIHNQPSDFWAKRALGWLEAVQ